MKPVYQSLPQIAGAHVAGICTVEIAPISWVLDPVIVDFISGTIIQAVNLGTRQFLKFEFTPGAAKHIEKPKKTAAGDSYDISVTGLANNVIPDTVATLDTLKYEKLLVIISDTNRDKRLIGSQDDGMKLQTSYQQADSRQLSLELTYSSAQPSPFYVPI